MGVTTPHAEAIGGARAEAERVIVAAASTRAESDSEVARERLLLHHKLAELTNQPYPMGTPTAKSNIYEHGEIDVPPCRNGRPDRVATEEGAHMRGEQKLTNKKAGPIGGGAFVNDQDPGETFHDKITDNELNTQGQSSPAEYYTTGGALAHPDLEEPFQDRPPAPSPPEAALPKGDYRYNSKTRHRQDDCSKMVNSGNRRSDMVTHDDAETAARNCRDSTEPTFHW